MIAFALVIFDDHLQNQVPKLAVQCQGRDSDDHESWFMIIPSQVLELVSWTSWLTLIFIKGGNRAEVRRSFITTTVRDEGHTTRAPPVGFEWRPTVSTAFQFYAIAHLDKTSQITWINIFLPSSYPSSRWLENVDWVQVELALRLALSWWRLKFGGQPKGPAGSEARDNGGTAWDSVRLTPREHWASPGPSVRAAWLGAAAPGTHHVRGCQSGPGPGARGRQQWLAANRALRAGPMVTWTWLNSYYLKAWAILHALWAAPGGAASGLAGKLILSLRKSIWVVTVKPGGQDSQRRSSSRVLAQASH